MSQRPLPSLSDPSIRADEATARIGLAALLGVAQFCAGGDAIDPAERRTIEAIRDHLAHQPQIDLDSLPPSAQKRWPNSCRIRSGAVASCAA